MGVWVDNTESDDVDGQKGKQTIRIVPFAVVAGRRCRRKFGQSYIYIHFSNITTIREGIIRPSSCVQRCSSLPGNVCRNN